MAVYRVINESGEIEAEFPIYSVARDTAVGLHKERGYHFRVEQVEIVFHTAQENKIDRSNS